MLTTFSILAASMHEYARLGVVQATARLTKQGKVPWQWTIRILASAAEAWLSHESLLCLQQLFMVHAIFEVCLGILSR